MPVCARDELQDPLPIDPTLKSADDVARALYELAWLKSREETINAAVGQRIDLLRREAQAQLEVVIRRKPIAFADRRAQLQQAIEDFARNESAEVFEAGSKTRQFACGKISLRAQPSLVAFISEEKDAEAGVIAAIEKRAKLTESILDKVVGLLRRAKLWPECKASDLLDVSVRLSKTKVKDALKSGRVTEQQLESLKLRIDRPDDKLSIEVGSLPVASESRQPAEAA